MNLCLYTCLEKIMKLKGKLTFRNNQVYVWNGNHEVNLFSWLASFGLREKEIEIELTRGEKSELHIKRP